MRTWNPAGRSGHNSRNEKINYALAVRIQFGDPRALFFIIERIRAMFDLNADWPIIAETLRADPSLAPWIAAEEELRLPGCWNGFELAARAILRQQVSVKAATTLAGRLVQACGRPFMPANGFTRLFPEPEVIAEANLSSVGLTRARAESIRAFARAVCDKQIRLEGIVDYDDFRSRLCEIPGIGKWTAEYVAMRALRDPDAFPTGDLVIRRALRGCTTRELDRKSEAWRPWRAYAVMLFLAERHACNAVCGRGAIASCTSPSSRRAKTRDLAKVPFLRARSGASRQIA